MKSSILKVICDNTGIITTGIPVWSEITDWEEENNMYNILVCDDEKDIVEALGIYLSAEGYQVTKAYNGQEACEKLKPVMCSLY